MNHTLRRSRDAIYPLQKQPNRQTLVQISSYFSKLSHTSDATAYMLATNMVSCVHLFAETLAENLCSGGYLYELVPTSHEDDRLGMMVSILAFHLERKAKFLKDSGANDICESALDVAVDIDLKRDEQGIPVLYFGEKQLALSVKVTNSKEPAYDAMLYVFHPASLSYVGRKVVDCEKGTAKCFQFECFFRSIERGSTAIVRIKARLWNSTFVSDYPAVDWVTISSRAHIRANFDGIRQTDENNDYTSAETKAYPDIALYQKTEKVALWIIILAACAGILLLIILIIILWKCGFFKRKKPG
ncbi:integrin alpha-PS1 [Trichonephila clavipes]|nr:integrin alpha-PS1 [Trichonephila clavipes]